MPDNQLDLNATMNTKGDVYSRIDPMPLLGTVADEWFHLVKQMDHPVELPNPVHSYGWYVHAEEDIKLLAGVGRGRGLRLSQIDGV